jgi:succinoglycan biosynthesis protein ExoA
VLAPGIEEPGGLASNISLMRSVEIPATAHPPSPVEITVIMPIRNERPSIERAIDDVLGQVVDTRFEVLAIDGSSEDGTRQILDARSRDDRRLRVIANPAREISSALNIGLAAAAGRYWVRVDGHSRLPSDYVQRLVTHLRAGTCEAAGGVVRALGTSPFGCAAAVLHDSRFGIGNARHHYASETSYIDHLSHGMYRVDLSRAVGGFDENIRCNEDYEFDYRYRQGGGRIHFDPEVVFERQVRDSPGQLARQFHNYGYWKFVVLRQHPGSLRLRWLAPPILVASIIVGVVLSGTRGGRRFLALVSAPYLGAVALGSATAGRRIGARQVHRAAAAMVIMHVAWGSGVLRSAFRSGAREAVDRFSTGPVATATRSGR